MATKTLEQVLKEGTQPKVVLNFDFMVEESVVSKPFGVVSILTESQLLWLFERVKLHLSQFQQTNFNFLVYWDVNASLSSQDCDTVWFGITYSEPSVNLNLWHSYDIWFSIKKSDIHMHIRDDNADPEDQLKFGPRTFGVRQPKLAERQATTTIEDRLRILANELVPQIHQWVRTGELANDSVGSQA